MDDIGVERACSLCGEQVRLSLTGPDRRDTYTDVLAELLDLDAGEQVVILAECGCDTPRSVCVQGDTMPADADFAPY